MSEFKAGDLAIVNGALARINYFSASANWMEWQVETTLGLNIISGHVSQQRVEEYSEEPKPSEDVQAYIASLQQPHTGLNEYNEETPEEGEARVSGDAKRLAALAKARQAKAQKRELAKLMAAAEAESESEEPGATGAEAGIMLAPDDGSEVTEVPMWEGPEPTHPAG